MSRGWGRVIGWPRLVILGFGGALLGAIVVANWNIFPLHSVDEVVPAPYQVPKIPGGTALRLAMVHDVVQERYLSHGQAWYTQRNREAQKILDERSRAASTEPSEDRLNAMDDLAVGLQRTGHIDQAIEMMRQKLAMVSPLPSFPTSAPSPFVDCTYPQEVDEVDLDRIIAAQQISPWQHQQYTTCANLGTFLMLANLRQALAGNAHGKALVQQGIDYVERAIAINSAGHFGRERWQAIVIKHLLYCVGHHEMLGKFDMIGNDLDRGAFHASVGLYYFTRQTRGFDFAIPADPSPFYRRAFRGSIDRVGMARDWVAAVHPDYPLPMPFDEPMLAIIGMWTMGGGPNPHFAMTIGQTMQEVGQLSIAWNAFERAQELKADFWPDASISNQLAAICRSAQRGIAKLESPRDPDGWEDRMRQTHRKELAWGVAYQEAYQRYEAEQIKAGVPLNDPKFYDKFFANRPPIASPPGLSDDVIVTAKEARRGVDALPAAVLGAGLLMAYGAIRKPKLKPTAAA